MQIAEPSSSAAASVYNDGRTEAARDQPRPDCMRKPLCITFIQSAPPLFVQTTAKDFRSVVQVLTGRKRTSNREVSSKLKATSPELAAEVVSDLRERPLLQLEAALHDDGSPIQELLHPFGCPATLKEYAPPSLFQLEKWSQVQEASSIAKPCITICRETTIPETPDLSYWDLSSLPPLIDVVDEKQLPAPIEFELQWYNSLWEGGESPNWP